MDTLKSLLKYKIYCDLDDVLCDFEKQLAPISGGLTGHEYRLKFGKQKFHELIQNAGVKFWSEMPWMPGGKELWAYISTKKAIILSAPMTNVPLSKIGKKEWVVKNLGYDVKMFLAEPDAKQRFSAPQSILIDDRLDTIKQWNSRGGIGIQHTSTPITLGVLKKLFGERI